MSAGLCDPVEVGYAAYRMRTSTESSNYRPCWLRPKCAITDCDIVAPSLGFLCSTEIKTIQPSDAWEQRRRPCAGCQPPLGKCQAH